MTKEEAIKTLKGEAWICCGEKWNEALEMASKALEKAPCEDCISRQAAIDGADAIIARDTSGNNDVVKAMTAWKSYVECLSSVQPKQRTGRWIKTGVCNYTCSECGQEANVNDLNYCPECDKKMEVDNEEA